MESKNLHDQVVGLFHGEVKRAIRTEKAVHSFLYQIPSEHKEGYYIYGSKVDEITIWWDHYFQWYVKLTIRENYTQYEYQLGEEKETDCYIWSHEAKSKTVDDFKKVLEKFHTKKQEDFLNVVPT